MAKYINADKLKAEIERRYAEYRIKMKTDDFTYYEGMADALDLFEQYIDSLQQEQPGILKSWRPSEEQMAGLLIAIGDEKGKGSDVVNLLRSLYYDLKKINANPVNVIMLT